MKVLGVEYEEFYKTDDIPPWLGKRAVLAQDACNLSGILHSFYEAVCDLKDHPHHKSQEWLRNHPIVLFYADKIASMLPRLEPFDTYCKALDLCREATRDLVPEHQAPGLKELGNATHT